MPDALVAAAPAGSNVLDLSANDQTYLVQARPLADATGRPFAKVVMAREIDGVLSLFPHARAVFAIAAALAVALALGTAWRARQITGARVA